MSRLHSRPTDEITQENARHPDFYTHSSLSLTVSADFKSISSDKGLHYRGSAHPSFVLLWAKKQDSVQKPGRK